MFLTDVILHAGDIASLMTFYRDVLGLPILEEKADFLAVRVGQTRLAFKKDLSGWRGAAHFAIDVPVSQFDQAMEWIAARTPLLTDSQGSAVFYNQSWNTRQLYFQDAAGNFVEFIGHANEPSPGRAFFDELSFQRIIEIGIPTLNVRKSLSDLLLVMPGVKVYRNGLDGATAVGDRNGMLVLIDKGRSWFPAMGGQPADFVPLQVEILQTTGGTFRLKVPPYPFDIDESSESPYSF